jgi:hypothetical protein
MKDISHLDLALAKIPTKALYKLQVSIAQEIQSRARTDATELQTTKDIKDTLKITLNEVQVEKDQEKKHIGQIEECIEEVFKSIPDNTQEGAHLQTEEKIGKIAQAMENYKSHITGLDGTIEPKHTPEVSSQREKEVAGNMENMAQSIKDIAELYDKSAQLWTSLQEDEKLQALEQKEESINTTMQELKQKKKAMNIQERLRSTQELKNLQAELKNVQQRSR